MLIPVQGRGIKKWREEDADAPGHPVGWENDFERRTWLKT
jgi:hypothetical protein